MYNSTIGYLNYKENIMRHLRSTILTLLIIILFNPHSIHAQDEAWSAILGTNTDNEMIRIYLDGAIERFSLHDGENMYVNPFDTKQVAINEDGTLIGTCSRIRPDPNSFYTEATFHVRNLHTNEERFSIDLGTVLECQVHEHNINEEEGLIAVSIARYRKGSDIPPELALLPAWEFALIDINTGEIRHKLTSETATLMNSDVNIEQAVIPWIRWFENGILIYSELTVGMGPEPSLPAFMWRYEGNILEKQDSSRWGSPYVDTSYELIWWYDNPNLPAAITDGPFSQRIGNTIMIADKTGAEWAVYQTTEQVAWNLLFVDGGKSIAVQLQTPDPNDSSSEREWLIINRDGTQYSLGTFRYESDIVNAPNGFLHVWTTLNPKASNGFMTYVDYHTNGKVSRIFSSDAERALQFIGSAPVPAQADLQPFSQFNG